MIWKMYHNTSPEALGFIPDFVFDFDPRPACEQFAARYTHGGGWHPLKGFKQSSSGELLYPGDPPMRVLAETRL